LVRRRPLESETMVRVHAPESAARSRVFRYLKPFPSDAHANMCLHGWETKRPEGASWRDARGGSRAPRARPESERDRDEAWRHEEHRCLPHTPARLTSGPAIRAALRLGRDSTGIRRRAFASAVRGALRFQSFELVSGRSARRHHSPAQGDADRGPAGCWAADQPKPSQDATPEGRPQAESLREVRHHRLEG
jgi:hypothetical protein